MGYTAAMGIADVFGYAGIFTGVAVMVPQVYKSWKTKRVKDLSWGMVTLFFLNCVFWLMYGVLTGAVPVILTNATALFVSVALAVLKVQYSGNA